MCPGLRHRVNEAVRAKYRCPASIPAARSRYRPILANSDRNTNGGTVVDQQGIEFGTITIAGTGEISLTGFGFSPKRVKFDGAVGVSSDDEERAAPENSSNEDNVTGTMFGYAANRDGTTAQQVHASVLSGNSVNAIRTYASSTECIGISYSDEDGAEVGQIRATLKSWDSDGFTINVAEFSGMSNLGQQQIMFTAY